MPTNINGKYVNVTILALFAFLIVLIASDLKKIGYIGKDIYPQRTIVASGEGEAYAIPDIASFSFGATEIGDTVQDAQTKVDDKINKALAAVKDAGVDDKDVQTTDYSVNPNYEWQQIVCFTAPCPPGKNVLKGYQVNENITIKVRDTKKAGDLITTIGALGLSNVSGLQFTVDDRDKYVALAREQAIVKAKANAEKMVSDLGVHLGKLLYFNENGNYPVPYAAEGMGGDMKAAPNMVTSASIPTGQTKITSDVSITYEIK